MKEFLNWLEKYPWLVRVWMIVLFPYMVVMSIYGLLYSALEAITDDFPECVEFWKDWWSVLREGRFL